MVQMNGGEKACDLGGRRAISTCLLASILVSRCNRYTVINNLIKAVGRRCK